MKGSVRSHRLSHERHRVRSSVAAACIVGTAVVIAAAGCASTPSSSAGSSNQPVQKMTIALGDFGNASFDPWAPGSPGSGYLTAMFMTLVGVNADATALSTKTGLADKWTVSPSGLQITFDLRNATFSNGKPITSADAKFSLERNFDPTVGTPFAPEVKALVKSISTPDAHTMVVTLNKSVPTEFLMLMSVIGGESEGRIIPKGYGSAGKAAFLKHPIDSGAYTLASYSPGQQIVLTSRKDYWAGEPRVHQLTFTLVTDDAARLAGLQAGTIDFASISRTQIAAAEAAKLHIWIKKTGDELLLFTPWDGKSHDPVINNPDVREALSVAIDRQAIDKELLAGVGHPSGNFVTSAGLGYSRIAPDPYDPALAKQLLQKSGVPLSKIDVHLYAFTSSGWSESPRIAEAIAGYWKAIGVNAYISSSTFEAFQGLWIGRKISGQALALEPMPGNTLPPPLMAITMTCSGAVSIGCSPQVDQAIASMNAANNDSQLVTGIQNAEKVAASEREYIGLLEVGTAYAGDGKVPSTYSPGLTPVQAFNTPGLYS
jgi:ABC-type transport system substrate-binding protein